MISDLNATATRAVYFRRVDAAFFLGFLGPVLIGLGVHLTLGGFIEEVAGGNGSELRETCSTGVFCTLGLRSGFTRLWAGILALVASFILIGKSSR